MPRKDPGMGITTALGKAESIITTSLDRWLGTERDNRPGLLCPLPERSCCCISMA